MFDIGTIWIKLNYFVLTNRQDLRKWWVLTLIAIAVFSTVFVITNAVIYIVNLPKQDALIRAIAASPLDFNAVRATQRPQPLKIGEAVVLPAGTGRYTIVAKVQNINKNWAATSVKYEFSIGGQNTGELSDAVMPSAEQYLAGYNISGPETSSGLTGTLSIKDVTWVRVPDLSVMAKSDFSYDELKFDSSTTRTGQSTCRVTGKVTNNSLSGFWRVKLQVVLLNEGAITGINTVFLEKFLPGESRSLYTQYDQVGGSVKSISVVPSMNLLDTGNLIR